MKDLDDCATAAEHEPERLLEQRQLVVPRNLPQCLEPHHCAQSVCTITRSMRHTQRLAVHLDSKLPRAAAVRRHVLSFDKIALLAYKVLDWKRARKARH